MAFDKIINEVRCAPSDHPQRQPPCSALRPVFAHSRGGDRADSAPPCLVQKLKDRQRVKGIRLEKKKKPGDDIKISLGPLDRVRRAPGRQQRHSRALSSAALRCMRWLQPGPAAPAQTPRERRAPQRPFPFRPSRSPAGMPGSCLRARPSRSALSSLPSWPCGRSTSQRRAARPSRHVRFFSSPHPLIRPPQRLPGSQCCTAAEPECSLQVAVGFGLCAYYVYDKRPVKNLWGGLGQARMATHPLSFPCRSPALLQTQQRCSASAPGLHRPLLRLAHRLHCACLPACVPCDYQPGDNRLSICLLHNVHGLHLFQVDTTFAARTREVWRYFAADASVVV